jgi:hypothetical protein
VAGVKTTRFSVEIEAWGPPVGGDMVLADLARALEDRAVGGVTTSVGGVAGGVGATFSMDVSGSGSAVDAARMGAEAFEGACAEASIEHGGIARVDVMTDRYLERWLERSPERYAGVSEVAELFGVSRQRLAELRAKPGFPAPVAELAAGPVWLVSSLNRFLEQWDRRPGRPRRASSA